MSILDKKLEPFTRALKKKKTELNVLVSSGPSSSCPVSWASQMVFVVKSLPSNAGDIRNGGLVPG